MNANTNQFNNNQVQYPAQQNMGNIPYQNQGYPPYQNNINPQQLPYNYADPKYKNSNI
jgi:hypothetical protein